MNPSDVIDQRYRLERLLGTGGMSEVWLAEDTRLGRWVAVKILRDSAANREDELVDTLLQEARVVARLQHPNIVGVYDFGTYEGHHYLVMEYVHGYSVRQLLQTQGRLTEAEAVNYGAQIGAALQYAHEQGIIHCDVKPENILVNEQRLAKVTDFGVAETVSRTLAPEEMRDVLGTVAYLAPEVIQGAPADPRSDVYSLALTIYEMVAGRLPFTGRTPAALAGQRLGAPAPPLRTFAMSASPELEAVLARALSVSQQDRYPTAGAFATALKNVPMVKRQSTPAAVVAPPGRPPAPPGRHTTRVRRAGPPPSNGWSSAGAAALTGAVLLAVGIGAVAAVLLSRNNDDGGTPEPSVTVTTTPPPATSTATNPPTQAPATATPTPSPDTPTPTPRPATPTPTVTRTPSATATGSATAPTASPTGTQEALIPLPTITVGGDRAQR